MTGSERATVALSFLGGLVGVPSLALLAFLLTFRAGAEEFSITFIGPLAFAVAVASLVIGTFRTRDAAVRAGLMGIGIGLLVMLVAGVLLVTSAEFE